MICKALIIEDDLVSGRMLSLILGRNGCLVTDIMPNAEKAFYSVIRDKPDIIFVDIDLSGVMDGIHTAELLTGYYSIPVIFVTGHSDTHTITRAKNIGFAYIIKPFVEEEIVEVMKNYLFHNKGAATAHQMDSEKMASRKISVKKGEMILFIDLSDILYFEAHGHMIFFYTKSEVYSIRGSLKQIKILDSLKQFLSIHKSYLINQSKVEGLIKENKNRYQVKMQNIDAFLPISRNKVKLVKQLIK